MIAIAHDDARALEACQRVGEFALLLLGEALCVFVAVVRPGRVAVQPVPVLVVALADELEGVDRGELPALEGLVPG